MQERKHLQPDGQYDTDVLSEQELKEKLKQAGIFLKTELQKETESTNTLLRKYAQEGEREDMLLLAEHQTGGRGRKGRNFYSPKGTGLYMSLLLHPKVPAGETAMLTPLAAAAVAGALEEISGKQTQIKWVNDILVDGKKAVGILTETAGTLTEGCFDYVIVGIGINVYEPKGGFPEEIRDVAGAVFSKSDRLELPCRTYDFVRCRIAVEVLRRFMEFYRVFPKREYLEEYRRRSALIGKDVKVIPTGQMTGSVAEAEQALTEQAERVPERQTEQALTKQAECAPERQTEQALIKQCVCQEQKAAKEDKDQIRYAKVIGIDEQCRLQVRYEDGREEFLSSGEVSIRGR